MALHLDAVQFESLARLCETRPEYGLLACAISERLDPQTIGNPELAMSIVLSMCRRLATNEQQAVEAAVHHLKSFRDLGALTELDAALLMTRARNLHTKP